MKPYPKYKDSGVEWIGEVPEGWEVKKIKHSTYVKGRVGWHGLNSNDFINEGPFLVTGTDFSNGRIDWNTCYHVSVEHYDKDPFIQLKENDLLITKDGSIGKVAIVQSLEGQATLNSGIFVTRPLKNQYLTAYLYWVLNSSVFVNFIDYNKTGSTVLHLYQDTFENFSFPLPLIQEQKAICYYLDRKTAQIDNLISTKQKLIELLKEERAAIINQAVTKGLNPDAPMKDSGIEWLGEIPAHWEVKRMKYVARITLGKMLTNVDKGGYHYRPYLRAQNINWEKVNVEDVKKMWFSKDELRQYRLNKNDLLVSEGGEVGRTSIWNEEIEECYIQNSVHKVTMEPTNDPFFFLYTFCLYGEKGVFESVVSRISIAHLTKEKLKEIPFPMPPTDEQRRISKFIRSETTKIDQTISNIAKQIDLLQEFRTALISEVVTGKIDVRDEGLNG
ncbi:MAG: restriction endonuclease subunit S [Dissulfuribacterales bacterium]